MGVFFLVPDLLGGGGGKQTKTKANTNSERKQKFPLNRE